MTQEWKRYEEEEILAPQGIVKFLVSNSQEAHWREKYMSLLYKYPYRKPTQVDEERILRRSGEALLRNSAN